MASRNSPGVDDRRRRAPWRSAGRLVVSALVLTAGAGIRLPVPTRAADDGADRFACGLVVDERRVPQAGARITVRWGDRTAVGEADGAGRFAIRTPLPHGDRAANAFAEAVVGAPPNEMAGTMFVNPVAEVRPVGGALVVVRSPIDETFTFTCEGKPAAGAHVRILGGSKYARTGVKDVVADAEGRLLLRLPPDSYTWLVTDARFAAQSDDVRFPIEETLRWDPRQIDLGRPRSVRVRALDAAGAPVAGVSLSPSRQSNGWGEFVSGQKPVWTDVRGEAVLDRMPRRPFTLTAWSDAPPTKAHVTVAADVEQVDVHLEALAVHTAKWPLVPSPDRPENGTPIVFRFQDYRRLPARPGLVDDDHVIVAGMVDPSDYGYAIDGERRAAWLRYELEGSPGTEVSRPATFLSSKKSVLRLLDDAGQPIVGQPVSMEGWFLLRDDDGRLTRTTCQGIETDAEGRVVFDGVFWAPGRLKLMPGPVVAAERGLGLFDPDATPDHEVVVKISRPQLLEIHVTIDGVPGLRSDLSVHAGGTATGYDADPVTGILRVPASIDLADPGFLVAVSLPGYEHWSTWVDRSKPIPVFDVDLRSDATIALSLTPSGRDIAHRDVQLHRFDEHGGHWAFAGSADGGRTDVSRQRELEDAGIRCWHAFRAAVGRRYRIVHVPSGSATDPFVVASGETVHLVTLSIVQTRQVRGRLLAPRDLALEHVLLEGDCAVPGLSWDSASDPRAAIRDVGTVDSDGTFEILVPDARATRITIRHPLLRETAFVVPVRIEEPFYVTADPRPILTIPFTAEGPPVAVRAARPCLSDFVSCVSESFDERRRDIREAALEGTPTVSVRRIDGDGPNEWVRLESVRFDSPDRLRLGVDAVGRYDVFVDEPAHAPVLLHDVGVVAEGSAHPAIRFAAGTGVRVGITESTRNPVTRVRATATPLDPSPFPPYVRFVAAERGLPLVLTGLVPGTWKLAVTVERRLGSSPGDPGLFERTIEVLDGKTPPLLEIDLRSATERRPVEVPAGNR